MSNKSYLEAASLLEETEKTNVNPNYNLLNPNQFHRRLPDGLDNHNHRQTMKIPPRGCAQALVEWHRKQQGLNGWRGRNGKQPNNRTELTSSSFVSNTSLSVANYCVSYD